MPALLGSLAGLLLAGLAEEKSGSMQVVTKMEANDADDGGDDKSGSR